VVGREPEPLSGRSALWCDPHESNAVPQWARTGAYPTGQSPTALFRAVALCHPPRRRQRVRLALSIPCCRRSRRAVALSLRNPVVRRHCGPVRRRAGRAFPSLLVGSAGGAPLCPRDSADHRLVLRSAARSAGMRAAPARKRPLTGPLDALPRLACGLPASHRRIAPDTLSGSAPPARASARRTACALSRQAHPDLCCPGGDPHRSRRRHLGAAVHAHRKRDPQLRLCPSAHAP